MILWKIILQIKLHISLINCIVITIIALHYCLIQSASKNDILIIPLRIKVFFFITNSLRTEGKITLKNKIIRLLIQTFLPPLEFIAHVFRSPTLLTLVRPRSNRFSYLLNVITDNFIITLFFISYSFVLND